MKFRFLSIAPLILVFILSISLFLGENKLFLFGHYAQNTITSWYPTYDNENKLKFVTKQTETQVVAQEEMFVLPVEILESFQKNDYIFIKTHDKSVVLSPVSGIVKVDVNNKCVKIIQKNITVEFFDLECVGVLDNNKIKAGQPIGSLDFDTMRVKVYLGKRAVSLDELKAFL